MKKILVFLLIVTCFISGCSFNVEVLTPASPQALATETVQGVEHPPATISPVTAIPVGFTPTTSEPVFFAAYVSADQNGMFGLSAFPEGTKQIFAHWNYQNMRQGLTIKREWLLDGQLWLTREEPWDFAKYGASGVMPDISIYDFDAGLPSGVYQLQLYIDGVQQPIGADTMFGPENWLNFSVLSAGDGFSASSSPDNLWSVTVYGMKQIVLRSSNNSEREVFSGREINYLTWFGDSKHFLFVDRDYSGQQPGSPVGVRDELYIADVVTGQVSLLNTVDGPFQEYGGPQPSLDGKYIAGLIGSGFGDACFVDTRLIFLEVASDFKSAKAIEQKSFIGVPSAADSVVYPVAEGSWWAGNQYLVTLNGTCGMNPSLLGPFVFDVPGLKANHQSTLATPLSRGDLGWGEVPGVVADAVTGKAIAGATVTCEHSSYTSQAKCSGSQLTEIPGVYIFQQVFFHDTDRIKLTVSAPGYQSQEFSQDFFTMNDLTVNFALVRSQ